MTLFSFLLWILVLLGVVLAAGVLLIKAIFRQMIREQELYSQARYSVYSKDSPPGYWKKAYQQFIDESAKNGFEHFVNYNNETYQRAGRPNFYPVCISEDRNTIISMSFLTVPAHVPMIALQLPFPALFGERKSIPSCRTVFNSGIILNTALGEELPTNHHPDEIRVGWIPESEGLAGLLKAHLNRIKGLELKGDEPIPVRDVEHHLEICRNTHKLLTSASKEAVSNMIAQAKQEVPIEVKESDQ